MAEERKKCEDLAQLLEMALEEKERWEKEARQTSVILSAMKCAMKKGLQNYVTGFSSSGGGDVFIGEEVCSNFRSTPRDKGGEDVEPAAKRKKLGGWNQWPESPSFSLCTICRSSPSCMLLLPCLHVNMCKRCAYIRNGCPLCGRVVVGEIEIIFPDQ